MCLNTKAVHIDLCPSLETDDFIKVLMRFVALRGHVKSIRSDNGLNYVGAEKELRLLISSWNHDQITDHLSVKNVQWIFQPPFASSMSGIWERHVKEAKRHLQALMRDVKVDRDTLQTLLYEVANIMNQTPLCSMFDDSESYEVLTPAHFLMQKEATALASVPASTKDAYRRRWRCAQHLADCYWKRWLKEYIPTLQRRSKWQTIERNLQPGDLVMLVDSNLPRSRWLFGRVLNTYPGKDKNVRVAEVKTRDSTYVRPLQKLVLVKKYGDLIDEG